MDSKKPDPSGSDPHEARVHEAFDHLENGLGERAGEDAREALARVREAAARRDAEGAQRGLQAVKENHGWLWEEMSIHPRVRALIDELSLWGL